MAKPKKESVKIHDKEEWGEKGNSLRIIRKRSKRGPAEIHAKIRS